MKPIFKTCTITVMSFDFSEILSSENLQNEKELCFNPGIFQPEGTVYLALQPQQSK